MSDALTLAEVMAELEACGTAQNRKVYPRHGIQDEMFGVSYANLNKLKKRIKTDQVLAESLWATGNHDAKVLATMVADPTQVTSKLLDSWAKALGNYVICDAFAALVAATPHAVKKMEKWMPLKHERKASVGWTVVSHLVMSNSDLDDDYWLSQLAVIEAEIHTRLNRVRHAMNGAILSIGLRNETLREAALETARRIGHVEVDHGETGCRTPDAVSYIQQAWEQRARRKKPAKKKAAKKSLKKTVVAKKKKSATGQTKRTTKKKAAKKKVAKKRKSK